MGLKEKRKKIENEIRHMVRTLPPDKVRKELNRLMSFIEEQMGLLSEVESAELNIS